jgi:hypothetical protein
MATSRDRSMVAGGKMVIPAWPKGGHRALSDVFVQDRFA